MNYFSISSIQNGEFHSTIIMNNDTALTDMNFDKSSIDVGCTILHGNKNTFHFK